MAKTIIQVPVDKPLRDRATAAARAQGFSSLQEAVRLFLAKLAEKRIELTFQETVRLSPKAIKRYNKITRDIEAGRNVFIAKDVDDLMKQLNAR